MHTSNGEPPRAEMPPNRNQTPRRTRGRLLAALLGGGLALLCVAVYWIVLVAANSPSLTEITPQRLAAARRQWQASGPQSYDIETTVEGLRPAVYRVEVRDGQVISATRDGSPLKDRRTLGVWSVPGMFDTIETDVEHADEPIRVSAREVQNVTPLGTFDADYGYPNRYRRVQWGSNVEASWEVTHFQTH